MNTRHPSRISRKAAEQLLDGAGLGPSVAEAPEQLVRVLAAAAAPGRPDELAGEQMAVAAFETHHLDPDAIPQRGQMIKSPLARILTGKILITSLAVAATGGVAPPAPSPAPGRPRRARGSPAPAGRSRRPPIRP
jgi:hypothetical protein